MAKRREIDPANVTWHAPESIHLTLPDAAERFAEQLKDASPEDVVRLANSSRGEYREHIGDEVVDGTVVPKFGTDRLVWVDDAPDDTENPDGHFEVFSGDYEDYQPVLRGAEAKREEG